MNKGYIPVRSSGRCILSGQVEAAVHRAIEEGAPHLKSGFPTSIPVKVIHHTTSPVHVEAAFQQANKEHRRF